MADHQVIISGHTFKLIPLGFCACGCGGKTSVSERTRKKYGWVKGQPRKIISGHNRWDIRKDVNKICSKCKKLLPITLFYRNKAKTIGIECSCKDCYQAYINNRYRTNETYAANHRQKTKKYREEHPLYGRVHQLKDPEKHKARQRLDWAIRNGKINKPDNCSRCGKTGLIHGHHPKYSEPLDVLWLCPLCHADEHQNGK